MKRYLTFSNLLFLILFVFASVRLIPVIQNNFAQEGQVIPAQDLKIISTEDPERMISFPPKNRAAVIFWATWCVPCRLEMARLSSSVDDGKIPAGAIIAINPFETPEVIRTFLKKTPYPFTFIEDNGISLLLNVTTTPTTMFIEENRVKSISSGLSAFGIWKAEQFLK